MDLGEITRLKKLARETGGTYFRISKIDQLDPVYEQIRQELRSQYLITYQSPRQGEGFREVEVKVAQPGTRAKTIRGYYP